MNTRKGLWAIVYKATNNLAAHQIDGHASCLPAIFRTRRMAREYCRKEYGTLWHQARVEKVWVVEER